MGRTYLDLLAEYGIDGAHPGGFSLTKKILKTLQMDSNIKLLDVGCGTGQTAAYISKTYQSRVTAVDINEKMIQKAADRFKKENLNIELVRADVIKLPFISNSFDIVLSESVTAFTNISKPLQEYSRVLKTGGILLAIEMTAETVLTEKELNKIKSVYSIDRVLTQEEWTDMLRQAGFMEIQAYNFNIRPTINIGSVKMLHDFAPHLFIIRNYGRKLRYRVYKCKA